MKTSLAIIIPVYNEELGIKKCINVVKKVLKKTPVSSSLIIVNDGSTDQTKKIIKNEKRKYKNLIILSYPKNKGYGNALRTGIKYAHIKGFKYALIMDSDLTNNPIFIPRFLRKIEKGYDCVKGSRYIKGGKIKNVPFKRKIVSIIGNKIASFLLDTKIKDCTNGFRILRLDSVKNVPYAENNFSHILEEIYYLKKNNARLTEIPVTLTNRKKGKSNFKYTPEIFFSYLKYPVLYFWESKVVQLHSFNSVVIKIKGLILHPIRSRIIFDIFLPLCISLFISSSIFSISKNLSEILSVVLLPFFFVSYNYLLGLYTTQRLAKTTSKIVVIIFSSVLTYFSLFIIFGNTISLILASVMSAITLVQPRLFLSFNKTNTFSAILPKTNDSVLVTGGGGYIGTMLVEKLLLKGYKVKVLDKFIYGKQVFNDLKNIQNLELIQGDITNPFILNVSLQNVTSVIHLAGIVGEPASQLDERLTRHINIISTRMLKENVKAFNIPRFIFASTAAVYGSSKHYSNENSKVNPYSIYTKTKVDSELELLHDTHDSFHPTILRISTAFGHSYKPKFDLVANLFVAQAVANKEIRLINGDQWRTFIHVLDVADAFIKVLEADISKISRQIFNIGNEKNIVTLNELANLTKKIINNKKLIIKYEHNNNIYNFKISCKKIKQTLNFYPKYQLIDGIKEVYENLNKNIYKKDYTDPYYSSYEAARKVIKEFYSKKYRQHHFSTLS